MPQPADKSYKFGPFRMDVSNERLFRDADNEMVRLSEKLFKILRLFVENPKRLFTKEELLDKFFSEVEENNLTQGITALRKTLGELPGENRYIQTVPNKGYRFVADVVVIDGSDENKNVNKEPSTQEGGKKSLNAEQVVNYEPSVQAAGEGVHSTKSIIEELSISNNGMEIFKTWIWGPGKVISLVLITCILLTIIFSIIGSYSGWEWTNLCVSGAQAIVLLIAIIYPQSGPKGFRSVSKNDTRLHEVIRISTGYDSIEDWNEASYFARKSLVRYTFYWRGILFTWLLLYVFLTALSHPALNLSCPLDSSRYCVGSFNDLGSIVKGLKSGEPDDFSLYLREHFSSETHEKLNAYDGSASQSARLQRALVHEFNNLLKDPYLPRLASISSIFGDEFRRTVEQKRRSEGLASANRLLLDRFYSNNLQNITTQHWGYWLSALTTLLNNLSSLMIILCFNVLNKPTETKKGERNISDTYFSIGAALVVVITMIEILIAPPGEIEHYYVLNWWSWGSGIIGGIAMALYVGRLQSKFLGPRAWLIVALYSYTAIQSLFVFLEEGQIAAVILINAALVLKCLLFLYMAWLFQSGRLLFYLVRVRRTYQGVKTEWRVFRNILEQES